MVLVGSSAQRQEFLLVYDDGILVFGKHNASCNDVYNEFSQYFRMGYLGALTAFLGLNFICPSVSTISINQSGYIDQMLIGFNMLNSRSAKTSLDLSLPLLKAASNDKRADGTEY